MTAVSSHRSPQASGTRYAELASALVKEFVGVRNVVGSLLRTERAARIGIFGDADKIEDGKCRHECSRMKPIA